MRLLVDTNVVLDVLMHRKEFFDASYEVLKLSALDKAEILITANTITDIYYIFQRANKDHAKSKEAIVKLLKLVTIADVLASDIMNALSSKVTDFEDALVGAIAKRVKAAYIVTRNTKDFRDSPVPAIDPRDFLAQVNQGNSSCG
ncbi:MAG TPA: PIN domain-containing protein [Syntrophothermus lipocalidus]|uniref:PilT protein domain protein n=1 Tax=Syntrophothermus lipocalidus (strain DSM 12680 / TGB-C1) TaxID=643648 RepID=D7CJ93_SYNLT|nr:PIN domain-containing protein [Syntrophothermus lipocalidus]ADI00982.1 PilT protein domain protein [Syntrophothermus lipocalidus DSM 12680]HHV77710.1 PIN domain-containing protein [Syntrophothermus lipocalidus]HOV42453.1 PIN domain-containing protein [Syntrophothermus lipocalidus]